MSARRGFRRQAGETGRFPQASRERGTARGAVSSGRGPAGSGALAWGRRGSANTGVRLDPPSSARLHSQKEAEERAALTWKLLLPASTGACNFPVKAKPLWSGSICPLAKMSQRRPERANHLKQGTCTGTAVWPRPGRWLILLHPGDSGNHLGRLAREGRSGCHGTLSRGSKGSRVDPKKGRELELVDGDSGPSCGGMERRLLKLPGGSTGVGAAARGRTMGGRLDTAEQRSITRPRVPAPGVVPGVESRTSPASRQQFPRWNRGQRNISRRNLQCLQRRGKKMFPRNRIIFLRLIH